MWPLVRSSLFEWDPLPTLPPRGGALLPCSLCGHVKLAFLGPGSAFSVERYNGAVVVDDRLLLDGGAPLLPHMHRLGIDPSRIEAILLSHFHGDHILGLSPF